MKCPEFERLIDFLDHNRAAPDLLFLEEHLNSSCKRCSKDRLWYSRVRAIAASDDTLDPPPWVINRAVRLFEARRVRPSLFDRLGHLVATLVFDSLARPLPNHARSVATSNRQLLYRAGAFSIDLHIASSDESSADLLGQVLSESEYGFESVAGLALDLLRGTRMVRSAITNDVGEFTFHALEYGQYELMIETREATISIPRLPFTPRA